MHKAIGQRCVIRGYASGVHLATVISVENGGKFTRCVLKDSRRIRRWQGDAEHIARSLSELATNGLCSAKSQVHINIPEHYLEDVIELIPATSIAIETIEETTNENK